MFTNPLQKLFPTPQDNYGGLLDPQAIQGAQQQQLLRFAAGLLGRTSGYSPTEAIGQAFNDLPDWNQVLHGMVGQRIALKDAQRKMEMDARRQEIFGRNPVDPNAPTPQVILQLKRLGAEYARAGLSTEANAVAQLLNAMGPGDYWIEPGMNQQTQQPEYFAIPKEGGAARPTGVRPLDTRTQLHQDLEDQRRFQRENALGDDYWRVVGSWTPVYVGIKRALSRWQEAKAGNGPAQIQMLYSFINSLDRSVVREGEAALYQRAQSIKQRLEAFAKSTTKSQVVPENLADETHQLLVDAEETIGGFFDATRQHFMNRAEGDVPANRIDKVFQDYRQTIEVPKRDSLPGVLRKYR